jgi:hypothetical protein
VGIANDISWYYMVQCKGATPIRFPKAPVDESFGGWLGLIFPGIAGQGATIEVPVVTDVSDVFFGKCGGRLTNTTTFGTATIDVIVTDPARGVATTRYFTITRLRGGFRNLQHTVSRPNPQRNAMGISPSSTLCQASRQRLGERADQRGQVGASRFFGSTELGRRYKCVFIARTNTEVQGQEAERELLGQFLRRRRVARRREDISPDCHRPPLIASAHHASVVQACGRAAVDRRLHGDRTGWVGAEDEPEPTGQRPIPKLERRHPIVLVGAL